MIVGPNCNNPFNYPLFICKCNVNHQKLCNLFSPFFFQFQNHGISFFGWKGNQKMLIGHSGPAVSLKHQNGAIGRKSFGAGHWGIPSLFPPILGRQTRVGRAICPFHFWGRSIGGQWHSNWAKMCAIANAPTHRKPLPLAKSLNALAKMFVPKRDVYDFVSAGKA